MNEDDWLEADYEDRNGSAVEVDDYEDDEDMETCSWCAELVSDESLHEIDDGARICPRCLEHEEARMLEQGVPDEKIDARLYPDGSAVWTTAINGVSYN